MNDINPFVFGKAAEGEYFTDRSEDAKRLNANLTHGINTILISPRRWGKTSLVKKVISEITNPNIKPIYIDIFQCKSEYEFYHAFASTIIKQTSSKLEEWAEMAKTFLSRVSPKFSFGPDPMSDFSLSFDWNPKDDSDLEILQLPEKIAKEKNIRLVVCIDEFQQIGEMPDTLTLQKTIRSVWQHHRQTSYCLFGSKQHLMANLFYSRKMPFYQFGDMFFLKKIPTEKWVPFLVSRFKQAGYTISEELAEKICTTVENYSAYVQQLAWNVLAMTDAEVTEQTFKEGLEATLAQVAPLFVEQTSSLSAYQLNLIRAICRGYHDDFGKKEVTSQFDLGSRSNLVKLKKALIEREILETTETGYYLADPLFPLWFQREMM